MRLQEYSENLFNCPKGTYFVQCGSADLALAAGIAVQFNERFDIKNRIRENYPNGVYDTLYGERMWKVECIFKDPVFTLITKEHHYDKPTYKALKTALIKLKKKMHELGIHQVAMPMIGCGLDRLNWGRVRNHIVSVFNDTDDCIDVYVLYAGINEKPVVDIYPSHIEVTPYVKGSNFTMEKKLSRWDDGSRRYRPFAYECTDNSILLPKGASQYQLQEWFPKAVPVNHEEEFHSVVSFNQYEMTVSLKNDEQKEIFNYLTHQGEYAKDKGKHQFTLEARTGVGKTVCMVFALLEKRIRTIVISHQNRIQKQWINTIREKTTMPDDRVRYVEDEQILEQGIQDPNQADIYIMTHQMIYSFVRKYGWDHFNLFLTKTGIGVKVIDEAHLFFENIMRIDMHTNISENYYLSATLGRSSSRENAIMQLVFGNAVRWVSAKPVETRKHVVYIMVLYNSHPDPLYLAKMQNRHGFSATRFIQYAISEDSRQTILEMLQMQMEKTKKVDGRTLIVSPTIDSSNYIAKLIRQSYPTKDVQPLNSSIPVELREEYFQHADVISSTIKSSGTGADITKLRFLHCLEPHVSMYITKQLAGRLREYSATDYTYFFDYFDLGVPQMHLMIKQHRKVMSEIAVKIEVLQF